MISIQALEKSLQTLDPDLLDIVREIHGIVGRIAPDAAEEIRRQGIVYYASKRGGPVSAGICQTLIFPDHIRLAFIHGAFLPDPKGLLQGGRQYKRYARIQSFDEAPWEDLEQLIRWHSRFDPYTQGFLPQE